ncbi:MAG: PEP-CTERM sorting domain-containing protein [Phycisphaerae bacterium]|nr:PEP-CTERM sorting domain-containing protein [Phycisphaerae bacterium]
MDHQAVTVINVVPEPATMSLLVLGGIGVLIRKRRK